MKKLTTLTAVVILTISVVSCTKTPSDYSIPPPVNSGSTTQEPVRVRVISDWQSLSLTPITVNATSALQGESVLTQIVSYDPGSHMKLAYVSIPGRNGAIYKPLPANYPNFSGNHALNFSLDFTSFVVTITNTDLPARQLNTQDFSGFKFRYIVIPVEVYQSLQVNWDDLHSVAAALNFSL